MYRVYHNDKVIIFTDGHSAEGDGAGVVAVEPGRGVDIAKVLEKLGNSKRLVVKSDDPEAVFRDFRSHFTPEEAAGGLVEDDRGAVLMIRRNGMWDLPKGHREPGESMLECALREVGEECGLRGHVARGELCTTRHIYRLAGRWTMKTTAWFAMYSARRELTPQREEGITRAEWVAPDDVPARLAGAYPLTGEVFRAAGKGE